MGVAYTRLTVRDPRSRWGSCSTTGALSLSWRLVMAPARVAEYVVVHEVAHLAEMNHSPAFWRLVAGRWPGYADDVEWLRRHGWWLHRGPFPVAGATAT
jgi:predicted metal-dependent hydrolase